MTEALTRLMDRGRGADRIPLALVGGAALLVVILLVRWGTAPTWIPLFDRIPLETAGEVTAILDEQGVTYQLTNGGTGIQVREADLASARIALAQQGLPAAGRPGFELFDQPAWGMTDFTQRVNYRRALEGELERTISNMRGIEAAQVHITLPERAIFRRDAPAPEASVVLKLRGGMQPDRGTVEGIAFLVASGVEGLSNESVRILDDAGRLLSTPDAGPGGGALSGNQMALRQEVEGYLEGKAEELLDRVMGPGNASVRVAADLNFDQVGRTVEAFDPEQQVMAREDRAEITPGTPEQGASSVTTNIAYENSRSVETMTRDGVRIDRLSVAVLVADRRVEDEAGVVTWEPRTDQELTRLEALIRNAVGVADERGDAISVVSLPMEPPALPMADADVGGGVDVVGLVQTGGRPLVALVALLVTLVLGLRLMKNIRQSAAAANQLALAAARAENAAAVTSGDNPSLAMAGQGAPVSLPDPQLTARLVRAWMNES